MKNKALCRAIVLVCWFLVSPIFGQEIETAREGELQQVFNDNFSTDTRGEYEVTGEVAWEAEKLTLNQGGSIKRAINGGPRAKLELDFGDDGWGADNEDQEIQLWFLLDGATDCYIRLRSKSSDANVQSGSVALVDTGELDGQLIAQVVRERPLTKGTLNRLAIEYRHGLVTVTGNDFRLLTVHIDNGSAATNSLRIRAINGATLLDRLKVSKTSANPPLTLEQQRLNDEATADNEMLIALFEQGKLVEAAEIGERVLKTRNKSFGRDSVEYSTSLYVLASLYGSMGNYSRAEPLFLEAQEIDKKIFGEEHPAYAMTVNNLGLLYESMAEYNLAEPLLLQSRVIRKRVFGEEDPSFAKSLNNLAFFYDTVGEYARAESIYLQALDIFKSGFSEGHPSYATTLNNLASLYKSCGDYARAEPLYVHACDILKSVPGESELSYATALNNLAFLYFSMGEYDRAELLYIQARDIRAKYRGAKELDYATSLDNLASLYNAMNDLARAEPLCQQAHGIRKKVLGDKHPDYSASLNNLGGMYTRIGDYGRAEPLLLQARDIHRTLFGEEGLSYAASLQNLSFLYSSMREYSKAEPFRLDSHRVLCRVSERVLPTLSSAQSRSWLSKNPPPTDLVLAVLRQQHKWGSIVAYESVWKTKCMLDRLRVGQSLGSDATPASRETFAKLRDAKLRLAKLVTAAPSPLQADAYRRALSAASERKETLEKKLAELNAGTAREHIIRDAKIENLVQQLPAGVAVIDFVQLDDWDHVATEITWKDEEGNAETRIVKKPKSQSVFDAFLLRADRPTENQAEWIPLGPAGPIEIAISAWRTKLTQESIAGSGEVLDDPGQRLRQLVWDKLEPQLDGIHTIVIIPDGALNRLPWAALPGRNAGEYLIHDYALTTASFGQQLFGILTDSPIETEPQLLVVGGIDYDLRPQLSAAENQSMQLAARGRPVIRSSDEDGWSELPGTEKEAAAITQLWGERGAVTELKSIQANEHSLARLLPQSRFAHLATHGFFDTRGEVYGTNLREQSMFESALSGTQRQSSVAYRNPLLMTGIVMAGANIPPEKDELGLPAGDDGILTAEEISSLDLRNTELVTLSACETGLGDVAAGEGVYGLTKALHKSGVRSVVASQWKVSDTATQELMRHFYENLWVKKQSKIRALRNAQLWMLDHPQELIAMGVQDATTRGKPSKLNKQATNRPVDPLDRTTPYFWAAFQLSGDWR